MRHQILAALVLGMATAGVARSQALAPALQVPTPEGFGLGAPPAPVTRQISAPSPAEGTVERPPRVVRPEPDHPPGAGPLGRSWQRAEYLLWWIKDSELPPLATANVSGASVATLDHEATAVVVGGDLDNLDRSGGRFTVGFALDPAQTVGLEGTYFFLGSRTTTVGPFSNGGPGTPALGVPFFDLTTGTEQAVLAAFPGFASGNVAVSATTRLQGVEANGVVSLWWRPSFQLEGLIGFRYLEVNEGLQVAFQSQRSGGSGTGLSSADQFDGHNRFYGGQVGLRAELRKGPVFLNLAGKVALGDAVQVVRIAGASRTGGTPRAGGIFALPTNSGRFERDAFAVVPEGSVRLGVFVNPRTRLYVGYDFLYLSDVVRPGDQIDRRLNPTQIPVYTRGGTLLGTARPQFSFQDTDFWAQGMVVGLEYRY
ncbi:MAG: BBP7 family outer membrane beta-barrel protein [Gemmataceae bacterium]|nr:BBP7 family outer membrane beta-barrel protein [Gemmataceae bacterium]